MSPPIRLAALDMAGTTVADHGAVEEAFQAGLDAVGLTTGDLEGKTGAFIRRTMGQSKLTVFTELLGGDRHRAEQANTAFEAAFDLAVDRGAVPALPGAEATFAALRDAGVRSRHCPVPRRPSVRCATRGSGSASPPGSPRPPGNGSSMRSGGRAWSISPSPRPMRDGDARGRT